MNGVWVYGKEDLFKIVEVLTNAENVVKIAKEKECFDGKQGYLVSWLYDDEFGGETFEVIDWEHNSIVHRNGRKEKFKFVIEKEEEENNE